MKKKLVAVLMTAAMAVSLAACSGAAETTDNATETPAAEATETPAADTAEEPAAEAEIAQGSEDAISNLIAATEGTVDLTLWCSELESYQNTMKELVDEFKTTYSDVDFNITIGAQSESTCKDEILKDVEAAADVFVFADDQLNELVQAGALQAVTATYTFDPVAANGAGAVNAASLNGVCYAYPLTASNGYFLIYDKSLLSEEDVSSWENLVAACEAQGKKCGFDFANGWYLYGFFSGAGCNCTLAEDGVNNVCDWNGETGLAVAEAVKALCSSDAVISIGDADARAQAKDGDLIAYVDGTWAIEDFQAAYGDNLACVKLPTFDVNGSAVQQGSFAGYKLVGVNSYSKNVGWAMLLAEYITNEASQLKIGANTQEGPANINAASQISSPALSALGAQSAYADLQRVGGNFWTPAGTLGQSLYDGTAEDVQKALDDAVAGITAAAE
ncbi:MAG: extracellular solute-binding protein [Lachnospiraceae bacterium]|nr:extracellular solute-binding protein [Lachnospiraceae bacterium]